jgi:hypothetical protein
MYRGSKNLPDAAINVSLSGGDLSKDGFSKNARMKKCQAWNYRKAYFSVIPRFFIIHSIIT